MKTPKSNRELLALKNIGPTIARRLNGIGVSSEEDLRRMGPAEAYRRMQAREKSRLPVCYYLYSLEGALRNRQWDELPEEIKSKLLRSVSR